MEYRTFPLSTITGRLNVGQLKDEIAAKTGYTSGDISLSVSTGGKVTTETRRRVNGEMLEVKEERPGVEEIVIGLPDATKLAKVIEALEGHAPEHNDEEACTLREKAAFDAKLRESDAFKELAGK